MTFIATKSRIKAIKQGDSLWTIHDGLMVAPRAGFEISTQCPREYKLVLSECIDHGWIKPVAYMRDDEYMWETLRE